MTLAANANRWLRSRAGRVTRSAPDSSGLQLLRSCTVKPANTFVRRSDESLVLVTSAGAAGVGGQAQEHDGHRVYRLLAAGASTRATGLRPLLRLALASCRQRDAMP